MWERGSRKMELLTNTTKTDSIRCLVDLFPSSYRINAQKNAVRYLVQVQHAVLWEKYLVPEIPMQGSGIPGNKKVLFERKKGKKERKEGRKEEKDRKKRKKRKKEKPSDMQRLSPTKCQGHAICVRCCSAAIVNHVIWEVQFSQSPGTFLGSWCDVSKL